MSAFLPANAKSELAFGVRSFPAATLVPSLLTGNPYPLPQSLRAREVNNADFLATLRAEELDFYLADVMRNVVAAPDLKHHPRGPAVTLLALVQVTPADLRLAALPACACRSMVQ